MIPCYVSKYLVVLFGVDGPVFVRCWWFHVISSVGGPCHVRYGHHKERLLLNDPGIIVKVGWHFI